MGEGPFSVSRILSGAVVACGAAAMLACGVAAIQPAAQVSPASSVEPMTTASVAEYQRASFLVGDGGVPFVGMVRYLGTESIDTTMLVVALSIPPRALSFIRAGDRYAAYYAVKIDILSGDNLVRSERPGGEVRVASFQETTRRDEGVIFQRALRLAPGSYSIRVTAQDSLSAVTGTASGPITVPIMANGVVAPMIPVFAADARPSRGAPLAVLTNPRATARYGRDSTLQLYIEAYGSAAPDTIVLTARPERDPDVVVRTDTIVFGRTTEPRVSRVSIPIARIGFGSIRIVASRTSGTSLGSAVVRVTLGDESPVATVDELLDALRYFASDAELRVIRDARPERRPSLWAALVRQTDPNPATPENEALHEYLRRVTVANEQFREDTRPAWVTDRGAVEVALGEPDLVGEPSLTDSAATSRTMVWEYKRLRLTLLFIDQAGFGRWRLTPASDAEFRSLLSISGPCIGCR